MFKCTMLTGELAGQEVKVVSEETMARTRAQNASMKIGKGEWTPVTGTYSCSIEIAPDEEFAGYTLLGERITVRKGAKMKLSMRWLKAGEELTRRAVVLSVNRVEDIFTEQAGELVSARLLSAGCVPHTSVDGLALAIQAEVLDGKDVGCGFDFSSVKAKVRGSTADGNERRVYEWVNKSYGLGLYAGLTVHEGRGTWSSWPTHEFETEALRAPVNLFPDFEEQFAFVTQPWGMWGVMVRNGTAREGGVYAGKMDTVAFRDREIWNIVLGSHPVVAAPGVQLAYMWSYCGGWSKT